MTRSEELFHQAKKHFPAGVNSPVRAFKAAGTEYPLFIERGQGSRLYDVDGNSYLDYCLSWGPLILGHAHLEVIRAIKEAACKGTSFGACCEAEIRLAKLIKEAFSSIQLLRMVSSGTEAVMSAIRLARGWTKKEKIVKFSGCYHGHSDSLLVKAGSGQATFGLPDSAGVPEDLARLTITLPFNDLETASRIIKRDAGRIACLILEPVAGNMGVIPPEEGFLEGLREMTSKYGILLIFDEVITGFRLLFGGAQTFYGIEPDLTCLGKIIGGGLPVGAFGGRAEIMERIAPLGDVYQAGTLSGNPVAMAAGYTTLRILSGKGIYEDLDKKASLLCQGLREEAAKAGFNIRINQVGSMWTLFWTDKEVKNFDDAKAADQKLFARFFARMLAGGVYLPPSPFESCFLSTVHTNKDIEETIDKARIAFREIKEEQ
ncbi:glutamate-1-semialdehyde 2,1-aminomutase [bacterium]|nr:glutamate-1-semialdehyde 2,1-aminomutase [bacterium]